MTILLDERTKTEPPDHYLVPPPRTAHEVIFERVGMGKRGARYSVTYRGEVICVSRDPEFAACRELARRRLAGQLVTRWKGSPHTAITMSIAWGAMRYTEETGNRGLRATRWRLGIVTGADFGEE
jgi:hypothetical protein